jgi:hypothetical protein
MWFWSARSTAGKSFGSDGLAPRLDRGLLEGFRVPATVIFWCEGISQQLSAGLLSLEPSSNLRRLEYMIVITPM